MLLELINKTALLLSLCLLQACIGRYWATHGTAAKLASGLLFGAICVVGMMAPIELMDGIIIDGRSVILSTAALFGGPLVGTVAGVLAGSYRLWLGGAGMLVGLGQIFLPILLGLIYRHHCQRGSIKLGPGHLLAFGAVVQALCQSLIFLLPEKYAMAILGQTAVPMLLVMPIVTVILGSILNEIKQREIDNHNLRVAATAFESLDGMLVTDKATQILRVNEAFTAITGYSAEEAIGQRPSMLSSGRQSPAFYQAMWRQLQEHGKWEGEVWNRRKNGEIYTEWLSINAVCDDHGQVVNYVGSFADVTGRKAAEEHIHQLAFYDPLTSLPNRRLLLDRLEHAMSAVSRTGQCSALMFIDLDNFKNINDVHGHQAGDDLLCLAAERLKGAVRGSDTVARLGGDEFVVMLEGLSGTLEEAATQSEHVAEQLLQSLGEPYQVGALTLRSSGSIGVVLFNDESCSLEELMKRADLSMYEAKAAGKHAVRFFDPRMQEAVNTRLRLEEEVRQGILQEEFIAYLQPQLDERGLVVGAECLARWQHPTRGLLKPASFMEAVEQSGQIEQLDFQILQQACRQLALWDSHPEMASLNLSVNVSARCLYQADFVERLLALLEQTGADPGRLKLELTETLLLDDLPGAVTRMAALKVFGIRFSIDDFGTGYSSLAYLQRLPLDQLKIDRSFVQDLPEDGNSLAIIRSIFALASSLRLDVIAEGVETDEQHRTLLDLGCHSFQGYLFGQPMPVADLEDLVAIATPRVCA